MITTAVLREVTRQEWASLLPTVTGHSYRQLGAFCDAIAARTRARVETVGVFQGEVAIGLAAMRVTALPFGVGGIAYLSGGPMLRRNGADADALVVLRALVDEYVTRRHLVLRVARPIEWSVDGTTNDTAFDELGFVEAALPPPYRTILIDLRQDLETIRARLHPKWRNCLVQAERQDLTVRLSVEDRDLECFGRMHDDLMQRKGFEVSLGVDFYREVQRNSDVDERFELRLVEKEGIPLAGHVGSFLGDTGVYLLGTSTDNGNKLKASYLLQWDALVAAKRRGIEWYDLGGIDPERNQGVYRFKARMNGVEVATPAFELQPSGLRARGTLWAERVYRRLAGSVRSYRQHRSETRHSVNAASESAP